MMQFGKLFLLPVPISEGNVNQTIPLYNIEIIKSLKKFILHPPHHTQPQTRQCIAGFPY